MDVFSYTDYQLLLRDYYQSRKQRERRFSYRMFASEAGTPPSLLKDIVSGRRRLTPATARKFSRAMKLTAREQQYFLTVVAYVNERTNSRKTALFNEIVHLRRQAGIRFLGEEHSVFFSRWYYAAIRELVTVPGFREDPAWIAEKLGNAITAAQAKKSIQTLVDIGILRRVDGRLTLSDAFISSEYEMSSGIVRAFNRQMIERAMDALETVPVERREISGLTLGVSRTMADRIKQRIRLFKEELLTMVGEDGSESETVYQMNMQLFPLVVEDNVDEAD